MAQRVPRETSLPPMGAQNQHSFKPGEAPHNPEGKQGRKRLSILTIEQRRELAKGAGITPMQFLMSVMVDDEEDMEFRIEAAKTAAPYFHRKKPVGIDDGHGGPVGGGVTLDLAALAKLSDEDLAAAIAVADKLGAILGHKAKEEADEDGGD
jgi:hypothetical protein